MQSKIQGTSPIVLLEHPRPENPDKFQDVVNAPLSANLLSPYISAVLRSEEIPVEVLYANLMGWSMEKTIEALRERSPRLLGVHMVYLWDRTSEVFDMLSRFHELSPRTHINLFGFFPTFSYEEILQKFTFIDSVTVGEPEYTFLELARFLLGENPGKPCLPYADRHNCHSEGPPDKWRVCLWHEVKRRNRSVGASSNVPTWQQAATLHASLRMTDGNSTNNLDYSGIDGLAFGINGNAIINNEIFEKLCFMESSDHGIPLNPPFTKGGSGGFSVDRVNGLQNFTFRKSLNNNEWRRVIKNRPRALISDLDGLPFPDRGHMHRYEGQGIATYILGSRGCYGHCTFCYINPFYGSGSSWRGRSAENIFEEIFCLYNGHGTRYFYFADANFFGPGREGKERASQLADLIIREKLNIRFGIECRANDIEEDSLSKLVRAGLREVFLGIESGCQHILNRFKKGVSTEVNARAVETLRRYGIEPNLGFIMFHPDSSLSDLRENFEFLKRLKLLRTPAITAHILHHRQTFFRGTPDFHRALNRPWSRLESVTGYEAFCEYNDPKVAAFSEAATGLCRGVLAMLREDDADVCNMGNENGRLAKINETIINAYDRLLSSFEDGEAMRNPTRIHSMNDRFLKDISSAYKEKSLE